MGRLTVLKQIAKDLASQFGPDCEIVIHDLKTNDPEHSIVYIENGRSGRVIHTTADERYLPYKPVKEILKELDSDDFVQCNRFVIVNRNYVETIDSVNRYVTFKNRTDSVEIGLTYKKNFLRRVFNG